MLCQEISLQEIKLNAESWYSKRLNEKIYLHTDRLFYLSGDRILFRIYLLEESTLEPLGLSKVAYVELLNNRNEIFSRQKIQIDQSGGNGYLNIPAGILSGYYYIRAYTHWMRNDKPESYFQIPLIIVNPGYRLYENIDSTFFIKSNRIDVRFFPEGGKLLSNVECLTALLITDLTGRPIQSEGIIVSSSDSIVAEFRTGANGLGTFRFKPEEGSVYATRLNVSPENDKIYYLPAPKTDGEIIQVKSEDEHYLNIAVTANTLVTLPAPYTIIVLNRLGMTYLNTLNISTFPHSLRIPHENLAAGVNRLVLLKANGSIESERLVYHHPAPQLNIHINKKMMKYRRREKVELNIFTTDGYGDPVSSDLSVSVFYTGDKEFKAPDIQEYLYIYSDIFPGPGIIMFPDLPQHRDQDDLLDCLMLTGVYHRFSATDIFTGTLPEYLYYPEIEGITLSGTVSDPSTRRPVPGEPVYLSFVGKSPFLKSCATDNNGKFYFHLNGTYDEKDIVLTPGKSQSDYLILIDDKYSEAFITIPDIIPMLDESWRSFIEKQMINFQISNVYRNDRWNKPAKLSQDDNPFYVKSDFTVMMEEFVRLPNMEEVFRELVKGIVVTRENNLIELNVLDYNTNRIIGPEPGFLVDGVPFFDSNLILEMNPEDITQIDIVSYKYFMGLLEMDGIIDIKTNQGDLSSPELPGNSLRQTFQTYQTGQDNIIPDYSMEDKLNSRIPDFRNLLYWNPSVRTDREGKAQISFYTSDNTGKYTIRIEGMTDKGVFGSALDSLEVE